MGFLYFELRLRDIFDRGFSAFRNGEGYEDCPYIQEDHVKSWKNGWKQAEWENDHDDDDDDPNDTSSFGIGI